MSWAITKYHTGKLLLGIMRLLRKPTLKKRSSRARLVATTLKGSQVSTTTPERWKCLFSRLLNAIATMKL